MRIPSFMRYPEAIDRVGPRVLPDWTGTERVAPTELEDAAELRAVFELDAQQLEQAEATRRREIEQQAERERAAGVSQSGRAEAMLRLEKQISQTDDPKKRAPLERCLWLVNHSGSGRTGEASRADADDRENEVQSRMADEILDS